MNISEANAVNTVIRAFVRRPLWDGNLPSVEDQQAAVDVLLRGAFRTLSAGLRPGDVVIGQPS